MRLKTADSRGNKICKDLGKKHLEGFALYAELANAIAKRLEETGRR
jgi:hypothetical protein